MLVRPPAILLPASNFNIIHAYCILHAPQLITHPHQWRGYYSHWAVDSGLEGHHLTAILSPPPASFLRKYEQSQKYWSDLHLSLWAISNRHRTMEGTGEDTQHHSGRFRSVPRRRKSHTVSAIYQEDAAVGSRWETDCSRTVDGFMA